MATRTRAAQRSSSQAEREVVLAYALHALDDPEGPRSACSRSAGPRAFAPLACHAPQGRGRDDEGQPVVTVVLPEQR
jgi:hypothetical protein